MTTTTTSMNGHSNASQKERYTERHTIGGNEYALTIWPPRFDFIRTLKTTLTIVASPVLLPLGVLYLGLLHISPLSIRHKLFGWLLPIGMNAFDKAQHSKRQCLLQHVSGRVLDVGSGSGCYLRYCTKADCVVAVEPVETLHPRIRKAADQYLPKGSKQLVLVRDLAELDSTNNSNDDDDLFDWIILGNVLCEVPSVSETLQRINRLLKPGGHVYFSEHMACPVGTWQRSLQNAMNPAWNCAMMGCNCNRDTLFHLQQQQVQSNWQMAYWTLKNVKVALGPLIMGLAYNKLPK